MADKRNKLECSICLQVFKKPKLLPCFHTFCEKCLTDFIKTGNGIHRFNCPMCRELISMPPNGVGGFQNNFYIEDDIGKHFCSPHKIALKYYCNDCSKAACSECVVKQHRSHNIDDLSTVEDKHKLLLKPLGPLTIKLKRKIRNLDEYSDSLKKKSTDVKRAGEVACKNVVIQRKRILDVIIQQGEKKLDEIKKICLESENFIQQRIKGVDETKGKLVGSLNCSRDILTGESSQLAVNYTSTIAKLTAGSTPARKEFLEIVFPHYPLRAVDGHYFNQQFGEVQTKNEVDFAFCFDVKVLAINTNYVVKSFVLQDLHCQVMTFFVKTRNLVSINLQIEPQKPGSLFKSCRPTGTITLVHTSADRQKDVTGVINNGTLRAREIRHVFVYNLKKLVDPKTGFVDENMVTVHATVAVQHMKYKQQNNEDEDEDVNEDEDEDDDVNEDEDEDDDVNEDEDVNE